MAVSWIAILPMLLALPVSQGMAKPDFWSLELGLPPFLSTRPISGGQIVVAKMKTAAISTLASWALVLTITPLWLHLKCDTENLGNVWGMYRTVYAPLSQCAIAVITVMAAMMITWSLLVSSIWRGYSGRTWFFYTLVGVSIAMLFGSLVFLAWCFEFDDDHGSFVVAFLPWIPWMLAGVFIVKCWLAVWVLHAAKRRNAISQRTIALYTVCWLVATVCFLGWAWLVSPRVIWLRDLLMLAALLAVPIARIAAAPLAVAWNRHR
jgi:hypothetical protein